MELFIIAVVILMTAGGQLLLKSAANRYQGSLMNVRVLSAYAMFAATVLLSFHLMKVIQLKSFTMIMSLNYVAVALLAPLFLGEAMNARKWAGTVLVSVGVGVFASGG